MVDTSGLSPGAQRHEGSSPSRAIAMLSIRVYVAFGANGGPGR
jgi:hypothetical protein